MKSVVLDATELMRDWLCAGLKFQLLEHMTHDTWLDVFVPASVFEETVAGYKRAVQACARRMDQLNRDRRHLGLAPLPGDGAAPLDLRSHLAARFDEQLGITILPWPAVDHAELVARATQRRPPFDAKGGGYRDALVWESCRALAVGGADVALVSSDKAFANPAGSLASELSDEVQGLAGTVELVQDFGSWLISELPWTAESLESAVEISRDEMLNVYLLQSDFLYDLEPLASELGFHTPPYACRIDSVEWDGSLEVVERRTGPDDLTLVEYDLGHDVAFVAEFPAGASFADGWLVSSPDPHGIVSVGASLPMVVRLAVLFGTEFGFDIDQVSWRRADGVNGGAAPSPYGPGPGQLSLDA